jgi:hypothetical protein
MTNECGHAAGSSGDDDWETTSCRRPIRALKQCLDENAIAAVKVELDGQAYAMEGLTKLAELDA